MSRSRSLVCCVGIESSCCQSGRWHTQSVSRAERLCSVTVPLFFFSFLPPVSLCVCVTGVPILVSLVSVSLAHISSIIAPPGQVPAVSESGSMAGSTAILTRYQEAQTIAHKDRQRGIEMFNQIGQSFCFELCIS